jgi:predicted transposase YdaD
MVKKADIGTKRLISLAAQNWVEWLLPESGMQMQEFLDSEFQWLARDSDVLLKVVSPTEGEFILLQEFQLCYKKEMPLRMRAYAALAAQKYKLPVYPVLINILARKAPAQIPSAYESEFLGMRALQEYRVINLWEVDVNLVFERNLVSLLPFVPILRGGNQKVLISRALDCLRAEENLGDLEPLLSFFATFVLELPVVRDIMRWDMTVLRESPWYNAIVEEGLQQGLQQGEVRVILRQLRKCFGTIDFSLQTQIESLSIEQLEDLGESILDFNSLSDLQEWLEKK